MCAAFEAVEQVRDATLLGLTPAPGSVSPKLLKNQRVGVYHQHANHVTEVLYHSIRRINRWNHRV